MKTICKKDQKHPGPKQPARKRRPPLKGTKSPKKEKRSNRKGKGRLRPQAVEIKSTTEGDRKSRVRGGKGKITDSTLMNLRYQK